MDTITQLIWIGNVVMVCERFIVGKTGLKNMRDQEGPILMQLFLAACKPISVYK